jgi:hypothetical protein
MATPDYAFASDIVEAEDDLEQINREYYMRGWTDGLPIIPPTEARVQRMLDGTRREPQTLLGRMPPRWGDVTVEKVAINALMAGCLPAYMPVLLTAVEAMLEPEFNLYGIQATTHPVAPLLILNGPVVRDLDVNNSYNAYGPGCAPMPRLAGRFASCCSTWAAACQGRAIAAPRAVRRNFPIALPKTRRAIPGRLYTWIAALRRPSVPSRFGVGKAHTTSMITSAKARRIC